MIPVVALLRVVAFLAVVSTVYGGAIRWVWRTWKRIPVTGRADRLFRHRAVGAMLLGAAALGTVCIVYGVTVAPNRLTVCTYALETPKLPAGTRVRLVHLADLHVRERGSRERALPDLVRGLEPDLILHAGDYFARRDCVPVVTELLQSWDVPQYGCLGNVDCNLFLRAGGSGEGLFKALREGGVHVLLEEGRVEEVGGARIRIVGFTPGMASAMRRHLDRQDGDTFTVVLYHYPSGFPALWDTGADLMLAGHTHGGQVALPFYGALITLDRFDKRYEGGLYEEHGKWLCVSRGIGCEPSVPEVRFWCPPEVVVIDLIGTGAGPSAR